MLAMHSLGSLQAEAVLSGAQKVYLDIVSKKVQLVGRGGQGGAADPAVYSLFGQVMLLKEAEYAASRGCHSPLSRPILSLQSQWALASEFWQLLNFGQKYANVQSSQTVIYLPLFFIFHSVPKPCTSISEYLTPQTWVFYVGSSLFHFISLY